MDRRTCLGAAAANLVAVPLAAMAQQTEKVRRIGFLSLREPSSSTPAELPWDPAPLRDLGWIEGKNLVIERRWAGRQRLPYRGAHDPDGGGVVQGIKWHH